MRVLYKFIFLIILILFISNKGVLASDTTTRVYLINPLNNISDTHIAKTNDTFAIDVYIHCSEISDSFNVIGLYLNFDTAFFAVDTVALNKSIVSYFSNSDANFTDSNGQVITISLNSYSFSN
ncbi:MAG TPA: hypothetical protein PLJ38_05325, partial [bacterium]|nr:hypothetical protein [bacterium]